MKKNIYQFDLEGNLIKTYKSRKDFFNSSNIKGVNQIIKRKSVVNCSYYLSFDRNFKIPRRRSNHNCFLQEVKRKGIKIDKEFDFLIDLTKYQLS